MMENKKNFSSMKRCVQCNAPKQNFSKNLFTAFQDYWFPHEYTSLKYVRKQFSESNFWEGFGRRYNSELLLIRNYSNGIIHSS